jgi:hypothetical protein
VVVVDQGDRWIKVENQQDAPPAAVNWGRGSDQPER